MSIALEVILLITTLASLCATGVMIWYVRKVLLKMAILVDTQKDTLDEIAEFSEHLEVVNSLDTFYGDPTLAALLEHTETLSTSIKDRVDSIDFVSEEDGEGYEPVEQSVG